ncbi:aminoglycoside phosphotransferase (APT) family kinase protein [Bradyrhizobium elkanii]|nr:aminoglycoside phosphotransferase (APT) family kinase protein [Bradyrhizobium elkanii]
MARLWAHVGRTGLFAPGVLDRCNAHLARIRAAYAWDEVNSVSSHNDSLPANILFDGNRLWMIDWESAYRTDPLVDLAIVGDSLARTPELESILHRAWLGRRLDEARRARLAHVRALSLPSSQRPHAPAGSRPARRRPSMCWARCSSPRS